MEQINKPRKKRVSRKESREMKERGFLRCYGFEREGHWVLPIDYISSRTCFECSRLSQTHCVETGGNFFSRVASRMKQYDKKAARVSENGLYTAESAKMSFYSRENPMIYINEDGNEFKMTLTSGPNKASPDRQDDNLGHFHENIVWKPQFMNTRKKASPQQEREHRENTKDFILSIPKGTRREYISTALCNARKSCKSDPGRIRRGITVPIETTAQDWVDLYITQEGRCSLTNHVLLLESNSPFSLSPDRIDETKGYSKGNVRFICQFKQSSHHLTKRLRESEEEYNDRIKKYKTMV
jgi:hypothetical protein